MVSAATSASHANARARVEVVNITAALQAWLANQPTAPGVTAIPIRVRALGKGNVTTHPLEFEYNV
jgi:hypothetical protein